jgi:glycosyltransferase involved in cell wall biosynthesis
MIKTMLDRFGIDGKACTTKLVQVIDNNDIDREVTDFRPTIVVVEAFWVVPEKFDVLTKLHPHVKWLIRGHSNMPFLAMEGSAIGWTGEYVKRKNVFLASNTPVSVADFQEVALARFSDEDRQRLSKKIFYFPNFYIAEDIVEQGLDSDVKIPEEENMVERFLSYLQFYVPKKYEHDHRRPNPDIHVGCFGAVRPLKNHLVQAVAALRYARKVGLRLHFHINVGRVEGGGDPIVKNLRALFKDAPNAKLVEHTWMPHDVFVRLVDMMDICLQVSFSETFNIVSADAVSCGVPVVVSNEINWVASKYFADPTSAADIVLKMEEAIKDSRHGHHNINQTGLNAYNKRSHVAISNTLQALKEFHDHHHYTGC